MFSKTTNRVHPSGSWKVLLVLQISSLEHSRNATLNDGQVSGGSNGNVPHRTPDPYYYYLTISEYLVICCWPCSINTFDFIFGCFFGYFRCCFFLKYFVTLLLNRFSSILYWGTKCEMSNTLVWCRLFYAKCGAL